MDRAPVTVPLQTGLKVIDALVPDRPRPARADPGRPPDRQDRDRASTPSSTSADQDVVCVYCAIGQRASAVAKAVAILREKGAMEYTVVVVAEGNDAPGLAYIAPVRRDQHRRALHGGGPRRADRLRRPDPARPRLPRTVAPAPPPPRTRGLSGRHLLHPLAPAGARDPPARRSAAADRSRRCRSSRPKRRTSPPTFRPT